MGKFVDLKGQKFGRLLVLKRAPNGASDKVSWWCRCACGDLLVCMANSLRRGTTSSCGCYQREMASKANRTHGLSDSAEHRSWAAMKMRCTNPNQKSYADYGERGIKIDRRWMDSFEAFYQDVGPKPSPSYTLERIKNSKGYVPGNVKWATRTEQNRNTRTNRIIYFRGEKKPVAVWAEELGIASGTIRARIRRGWSMKAALSVAVTRAKRELHMVHKNGGVA